MTGRILADLGADVIKVEPPGGDPLRPVPPFGPDGTSLRHTVWNAGKSLVMLESADDPRLAELLAGADVVIATPAVARRPRGRSGGRTRCRVGERHLLRRRRAARAGGRPATSG